MQAAPIQLEPAAKATAGPAAELRHVSKIYGTFAALRDISASFPQGTCTMILGENGAGKSTLLRMLAGLIEPTHGTVQAFGSAPNSQRDRIAYMSHSSMLYDELSAIENLEYFSSLSAGGACDCVGSPEMALRAVGLDPKLKRAVGQYSQGMRQRTSMARVLQSDPELMLLDEPFSNLDIASVQMMVSLIADFRTWPTMGGGKRTVVLTTHQPQLAESVADVTLQMQRGRISAGAQD